MAGVTGVTGMTGVGLHTVPPELPTPTLPAPELARPVLSQPELPLPLLSLPELPLPLLPFPELPLPWLLAPELPTPMLLIPELVTSAGIGAATSELALDVAAGLLTGGAETEPAETDAVPALGEWPTDADGVTPLAVARLMRAETEDTCCCTRAPTAAWTAAGVGIGGGVATAPPCIEAASARVPRRLVIRYNKNTSAWPAQAR